MNFDSLPASAVASLIAAVSLSFAAPGHGASANHSAAAAYIAGTTFVVTNVFTYEGSMWSLLFRPQLPSGWSVVTNSLIADGSPEFINGEAVWVGSLPSSPIRVTYAAQVPATESGTRQIRSEFEYQPAGSPTPITAYANPDPLNVSSATPDLPAVRDVLPGNRVVLAVNGGSGGAYSVEERLPAGLAAAQVSHQGVWDAASGKVMWGPLPAGSSWTLEYTVTGMAGSYTLTGSRSSGTTTLTTLGVNQMTIPAIWVPYIPNPAQAKVAITQIDGVWQATVSLTFPNTCYRVADWGSLSFSGQSASCDVQVEWTTNSLCATVQSGDTHVYTLGFLRPGPYVFFLRSRTTNLVIQEVVIPETPTGLLLHLPLNGTASDFSGGGHHGQAANVIFTPDPAGIPNGAAAFHGSTSRITVADSPDFKLGTNSFALACWVNLMSLPGASGAALISKFYETSGWDARWRFYVDASGRVGLHWSNATVNDREAYCVTALSTGAWHHVAAVMRRGATNVCEIYVDGASVPVAGRTSPISGVFDNSMPIMLGQDTVYNMPLDGVLDDVRLYSRALTQTEIRALIGTQAPAIAAFWPSSVTLLEGEATNIVVSATGTLPLSYQWNFNGVNLPGQTNAVLMLLNVRTNQSGAYTVAVSNSFGSVTSAVASVVVRLPARVVGLGGDLAFGNLAVGSTAQRTLFITNSGNTALNVSGIRYPAGFSGAWNGTVAPGTYASVSVTFSPSNPQVYTGLITVTNDGTGGNTIAVSGVGTNSSPGDSLPMESLTWEGIRYTRNVYQGTWFPAVTNGTARFATDDYSWLMLRTRTNLVRNTTVTLDALPYLASGGVNADGARMGFGDQWPNYQGRFVGLALQGGQVHIFDSAQGGRVRSLGAFASGSWTTWSLSINDVGSLVVGRPGYSDEVYTPTNAFFSTYRFLLTASDTVDGMLVKNVAMSTAPAARLITSARLTADGRLLLIWRGGGLLQWSPTLSPPVWQTIPSAVSGIPFLLPSGGTGFYRVGPN